LYVVPSHGRRAHEARTKVGLRLPGDYHTVWPAPGSGGAQRLSTVGTESDEVAIS
jgi:hypothetical protein